MIKECYTQIQLIHNLIFKIYKESEKQDFTMQTKILSSSIILIQLQSKDTKVCLRLIQIQAIVKIQITTNQSKDSLWFNCRRHINNKLGNTYSLNNIINIQVLQKVLDTRVFKYFRKREEKSIEVVLSVPLIVAKILKYLKFREGEEILLLNRDINRNLNSNSMYKAIYEARFGKTGFGLNLSWRKNYVRKIKEKESIY